MNLVMSNELFATLLNQRDQDDQIKSVGSNIGTVASLLWPIRNSMHWLEMLHKN